MSYGFISATYSGSVNIVIGFIELTNIPQAKVFGKCYSTHFSIILLVWSGILSGWNAYKNTDGLF